MSDREEMARQLARERDLDWGDLRPTERDKFRRAAERQIDSGVAVAPSRPDQTNAAEYVGEAMRGRLDDLIALRQVIDGDADQADPATVEGLDIGAVYDDHELQTEPSIEDAERALDAYPLCVEATTTFEVVLGTGGPDDRLLFECGSVEPGPHDGHGGSWEIRRVLYRYSWSGSAEVELTGEDREAAEALARRVVPELSE